MLQRIPPRWEDGTEEYDYRREILLKIIKIMLKLDKTHGGDEEGWIDVNV